MSMSISAHLCTKCLENLETGDRNVRHEKFTSTSPLDKPSDLAFVLKAVPITTTDNAMSDKKDPVKCTKCPFK